MQTNFLRRLIFDEKSRSLLIQTLVIGLFALFIYLIAQQTAYNLEKRGISSGFDFLNIAAGYDISIRLIPFTSEDTHLRAYFVGLLNTLMIAVCGCFLATIIGFLVGVIRLSSNWLFRNIAYVYVEFITHYLRSSTSRPFGTTSLRNMIELAQGAYGLATTGKPSDLHR